MAVPRTRMPSTGRSARPRAAPVRRTQAERREGTRVALLDGALDQLVAGGLGAFTTTEVCRRAGVSQGALFKHFASKAELLAAVAEHLFAKLRARYAAAYVALPATERSIRGALAILWEQMLDPRLAAAFELYTAARTDRELGARLAPVVQSHLEEIEVFTATLVDLGDPERLRSATALAIAAMQGLVLNQMALPAPALVEALRADLEVLAALLLTASPAVGRAKRSRSKRRSHG